MPFRSALLRTTTAAALVLGPILVFGTAQAQIATTGDVFPNASAPPGGSFLTTGEVRVGSGGGPGTLNTNRIVIDNALLEIEEITIPNSVFDGANMNVGTDAGEGSVLIRNGGELLIENTGTPGRTSGAGLQVSNFPVLNGPASLEGRFDVTDSTVTIRTDDGSAAINVGLDGIGTFNAINSAVNVQSGTGGAFFSLGGSPLAPSPQPWAQGTATFDSSTLQLNSDSATGRPALVNIGLNAPGTTSVLNIVNGSTVTLTNDDSPGATFFNIGRNGTIGVTNTDNSTINVDDYVDVSRDGGTGTLNLTNGAVLNNTAGIGLTQTGSGGGTGIIAVRSGSILNTNNFFISRDAGSTGTVTVADAGSSLNVTDTIVVGREGTGTLNIGDGAGSTTGIVNAHTTFVGTNQGSTGTLNMSGDGALLNLAGLAPNNTPGSLDGATLLVGLRGTGTVNLSDGANIVITATPPVNGSTAGMLIGGSRNNPIGTGDGTVNVDGTGTVLTLNGGLSQIGRDGKGVLNITNGGSVVGATQVVAAVGRKPGGDGTVNVTGAGSTWTANRVTVGIDTILPTGTLGGAGGKGALNVANGGSVTATEIFVAGQGRLTGGGGSIAADIIIGDAAIGGGTIAAGNSPGLMSVSGNLGLLGGSTMEIELGGTVFDSGIPQTDYDRVDVSDNALTTGTVEGTATIDAGAIFDIDFFGAFAADLGDTFDVLVADDIDAVSLTSLIFDFTGAALATGLDWDIDIVAFGTGREALQLSVVESNVAVSAPEIPVLLGICVAGLAITRRRRRI